jgi:hypothetical protein
MNRLTVLTVSAVLGLLPCGALSASGVGEQPCVEAISETMLPEAPERLREIVLRTCLGAFGEIDHKLKPEEARDRHVAKLKEADRLVAAYACTTAMSIAYE